MVVGDTGVGKTTLLIAYTTNAVPWEYIPTVFDPYTAHILFDGRPYALELIDTFADSPSSQREELYSKADIVMIMFDLMNRDSFYNVKTKWKKEIDLYCSDDTPYVLVGNKHWERRDFYERDKGLMDNLAKNKHNYLNNEQSIQAVTGFIYNHSKQYELNIPNDLIGICYKYYFISSPVSKEEGMKMMKEIGAKKYLEHAILSQGCKMVFDEVMREAVKIKYPPKERHSCSIL